MVLFFGGVVGVHWSQFRAYGILTSAAGVLVLEDSDSDFRTPPFEDAVLMFGSDGKTLRKVSDRNICQTVGGCRSFSMATDGRFLTVCENVGNQLTAYQLNTGERLWSLRAVAIGAIPGRL